MAGGGIDSLGVARGRAVTPAIVRSAEMRAALDYLAGDIDVRKAGVVACLLRAAARIFRNAACLWRVGFVLLGVPIGGPFPGVADHVLHAVAVRRKRGDGGGPLVPIRIQILPRKVALPG